jgi:hypothetical protein
VQRKDVKIELVKIFVETEYEHAYIDDKFIENYLQVMWKRIFEDCRSAIKMGRTDICVDDFVVSSYSGGYPSHERADVYNQMLPHIQEALDDSGIPYKSETYTISKTLRFKINVEELREFANVEKLQLML